MQIPRRRKIDRRLLVVTFFHARGQSPDNIWAQHNQHKSKLTVSLYEQTQLPPKHTPTTLCLLCWLIHLTNMQKAHPCYHVGTSAQQAQI